MDIKDIIMRATSSKNKIKTRYHKILFDKSQPFGHRVERDKSKQIPRKDKYRVINIDEEE